MVTITVVFENGTTFTFDVEATRYAAACDAWRCNPNVVSVG